MNDQGVNVNTSFGGQPYAYDMAELGRGLGLVTGYFVTRDHGERAYSLLTTQLSAVPLGSPLVLIFPPNQLMDASFADEAVVRLGEEIVNGAFGERAILLQGLTADSIKNMNAVIELRRLKLGFLGVDQQGGWQCVGHIEPALKETLQFVAEQGEISAPDLASQHHLAINTASTRLKRLYDQHLVTRTFEVTKKGLEYTYRMWSWRIEGTNA